MRTVQFSILSQRFRAVVKGHNFMTPEIIDFIEIKDGIVELSRGEGIFSKHLYGVTVVRHGKKNDDLSTCFRELEEAKEYIKTL